MMKLVAPVLLLAALILAGCASKEEVVRDRLAAANYCQMDTDCVVVPGVCPFDCYVLTHRSESGAIAQLMNDYPTTCMYSCIEQPPFSCIAGRCEFQR
jgi:hypothetical protein